MTRARGVVAWGAVMAVGAVLVAACGDETTSESEITCCFNGSFFECSDASNTDCTDPANDCDRDPSRDGEC